MTTEAGRAREKAQPCEIYEEFETDIQPLKEQIRRRAYGIWLLRGDQDGSDVAYWVQAEEEILREIKR